MSGNDRVRFCDLCNLHVYNISQMKRREAEALVAGTEGRLCARLFRRADGTVITKDCPVGLRAIQRRVARIGGAVFTAILSLTATIAGQKPAAKDKSSCQQQVTVTKSNAETNQEAGSISGTVVDPNGAVIAGVRVMVARKNCATLATVTTDENGKFQFRALSPDIYELTFESKQFAKHTVTEIKIGDNEVVNIMASLQPKTATKTIGIIAISEPLETTSTIFTGDLIRRLPH
jgi:hypothetical protein